MRASRHLITAPTADVVTAAAVRTMLGITDADDVVEALIGAVVATLDPSTGGWLGRALSPQTWELRLDRFPAAEIDLPYPPLTELTSVKYDDGAGDEQTLIEDTDYRVFGLGQFGKASVAPVYGGAWPSARSDVEAVRIRYVCGYAAADMPQTIKSAIALGVKQLQSTSERNLFLSRESVPGVLDRQWVVSDAAGAAVARAIDALLSTYRVWG